MEGRRILGLIFLLIISIHAEDSNEVKIPEQDPVKLAKPAPVKVAAPAPVKQAAPVKVAAPAPVKVAAPVKAVKAPEPIDPVVKPTPKAPEKVPQAPAEIPKARIPAAQKIQARIEEEKSIDDLSAQDQLPKIAESDYCGAAVSKLCSRKVQKDDYLVYNCLEQAASVGKFIDDECQHFLWIWKHAQTENPQMQEDAIQTCRIKKVESIAPDCVKYYNDKEFPFGKGNKLIPCLMDYRLQLEEKADKPCRAFLTDVSRVIFGDFRLICNFVEHCRNDIEMYKCGRETFGQETEWSEEHSQGEVVHCLEEHMAEDQNSISKECVTELVNLAELSADDFQLDRSFYLACNGDRDHFDDCSQLAAGDGAVYRCLFGHKFAKDMSKDCFDAIEIREKLIYENDYKSGWRLHKKCRKTLLNFGCDEAERENLQMSQEFKGLAEILLCVEKKLRHEAKDKHGKLMVVDQECDSELMLYRQFLMEDYELSPEVVKQCAAEIRDHCDGLQKQGETLHCLMGLETSENDEDIDIKEECTEALYNLIEETEAENDFHVDKRLEAACSPVVQTLCTDTVDDDAEILSCLLENVHSAPMISQIKCRKALLEVQYFLSRDFSWDKKFRKNCASEAEILCGARDMIDIDDEDEMEIPLSLIIGCLYRHVHPFEEDIGENAAGRQLTPKCATEVHRVMKERAMEVELNPDLEAACRPSLGSYCSEGEATKNIEFICLQGKYQDMVDSGEEHDAECAAMVSQLTGIASEDLDLEQVLFAACEPMVEKFCSQIVKQEDEGQVLGCLINHKNDEDMDDKCRAGVFHFQIISLSDYKLTYAFFKACKHDIKENCGTSPGEKQSKPDIVHCLSQSVRDDILTESDHRISGECREQVNFELLAEFEHIKLNPDLQKHCESDVKKYCANVKQGAGRVEECLKKQESNLSKGCLSHVFKDMQLQAENPVVDYYLIKTCKEQIKTHCASSTTSMTHVVECLAQLKHEKDMGSACWKAVRARQLVTAENIQLNPILMNACKNDITSKCFGEFQKIKDFDVHLSTEGKVNIFEGSVISCLKNNFVLAMASKDSKAIGLSPACGHLIEDLMKEESADAELDPELRKHCGKGDSAPLNTVCRPDNHEDAIECLKEKFMDEELKGDSLLGCRSYIAKLIKESEADLNVDLTLQNSCGLDIKLFCSDIAPGHGRRITCLVNTMKKKPTSLTEECLAKLTERQGMWNRAQAYKLEGLQDIAQIIVTSNNAHYILISLAIICICLMLCGLWVGRLTSKVRERKAL